jgi:hypothetical protein
MPIRPENKKRYPPDWKKISAYIRFTRATVEPGVHQCECEGECGRGHYGRCPNVHGEPAYGTGSVVVLTVAHLNHTPEVCGTDDDPYCFLRAMCQGCHLHYDKEHHEQTRQRTRERELLDAGQQFLPLDNLTELASIQKGQP